MMKKALEPFFFFLIGQKDETKQSANNYNETKQQTVIGL
jgi:hypothetical protein